MLNIKSEEAHRLARQVAQLTGETLTAAVTVSLRERLNRIQRERKGSLARELLAIGQDCAKHLREPWRSVEHGDLLYGKDGLPG